MKNTYVKPGFSFAPMSLAVGVSASCADDVNDVFEIFGIPEDYIKDNNAFTVNDGCENSIYLDQYCKFSSVNLGKNSIFGS